MNIRTEINSKKEIVVSGIVQQFYDDQSIINTICWTTSRGVMYDPPIITDDDKDVVFPLTQDGWYTAIRIVLPTKDWYDSYSEDSDETEYNTIYYIDNGIVYKGSSGSIQQVGLKEVFEINPVNTTVIKSTISNVSNWHTLDECFYEIMKSLEHQGETRCPDRNTSFKSDLLWTLANVMEYMSNKKTFLDAQKIYEFITEHQCGNRVHQRCNCKIK